MDDWYNIIHDGNSKSGNVELQGNVDIAVPRQGINVVLEMQIELVLEIPPSIPTDNQSCIKEVFQNSI